ncbi:hypothetical protein D9601_12170 [Sphingomonas sp. MA1305]|nr:hypothetical protein [Sphingomonas sp. MA1305]
MGTTTRTEPAGTNSDTVDGQVIFFAFFISGIVSLLFHRLKPMNLVPKSDPLINVQIVTVFLSHERAKFRIVRRRHLAFDNEFGKWKPITKPLLSLMRQEFFKPVVRELANLGAIDEEG